MNINSKMLQQVESVVSGTLRQAALGSWLLNWYPMKTEFYDQQVRIVPRQVQRDFKLWKALCSQESNAVYRSYQGGDVIDIGSFRAFYSLLLAPNAKTGDTFLSFEPNKKEFHNLLHRLGVAAELFPNINFCALPFPVGDGKPVSVSYPMGEAFHPQYASRDEGEESAADSYSIDVFVKLMRLKPSFIKIDVEGAEYKVLTGMQETLTEFHPAIMLELHPQWQPPGCTIDLITSLLSSYCYSSEDITHDSLAIRQLWK